MLQYNNVNPFEICRSRAPIDLQKTIGYSTSSVLVKACPISADHTPQKILLVAAENYNYTIPPTIHYRLLKIYVHTFKIVPAHDIAPAWSPICLSLNRMHVGFYQSISHLCPNHFNTLYWNRPSISNSSLLLMSYPTFLNAFSTRSCATCFLGSFSNLIAGLRLHFQSVTIKLCEV